MNASSVSNPSCEYGYAYVGNYLSQCAKVEAWALEFLQANASSQTEGKKAKLPHLFGQRLKAIIDLTQNRPELFSKPNRVSELMERFAEPAKMRSNLAHSIVCSASKQGAMFWLFHNAGTDERYWSQEEHMKTEISELKKLVKEITDQKLKPNTKTPLQN